MLFLYESVTGEVNRVTYINKKMQYYTLRVTMGIVIKI